MQLSYLPARNLCVSMLLSALGSNAMVSAAEDKNAPKQPTANGKAKSYSVKDMPTDIVKITGILADRSWGQEKWRFQVLTDGELAANDYILGENPDPKLVDSLKQLFHTGRVQVEYKMDGDARRLLSIKRLRTKAEGSVTGMPPDQHKEMLDKVKTIDKGDIVTITYFTDFERHRMYTLQKVGAAKK